VLLRSNIKEEEMSLRARKEVSLCDPYAWEDPRYLFRSVWPSAKFGVCASELINRIIFVYIFVFALGAVASCFTPYKNIMAIAGIIGTLFLIPTFMKLSEVENFRNATKNREGDDSGLPSCVKEGFNSSSYFNQMAVPGNPLELPCQSETLPNTKNPFHNVMVDEIKYAPSRGPAPDITTAENKHVLDSFFRTQWFSDPTDVFGKSQSQRQFITQPVTTVPNDQGSYQSWLYKIPGKTCKEGNGDACYGGSDGGIMPWANI
jgi:hypothetical protein